MHDSVHKWMNRVLARDEVADKNVLEVGSLDVNGSVRTFVCSLHPRTYTGTDMRKGPSVDYVCDAADLPVSFPDAQVIISTEMLEHVLDWRAAMDGMIRALAEKGLLLITTRSNGFGYHGYPHDYWRFSVPQMCAILDAAGLDVLEVSADPQVPGVFAKARKLQGWCMPANAHMQWDALGDLRLEATAYA